MNAGLVLEGGAMRGVFTAGVLDYFMEEEFYLPYVVGVSAGACNGTSYVSKQPKRTKKVTIDYIDHPEYLSFQNLFRKGEFFGMDLLFRDIPLIHEPFDFETFFKSKQTHLVGVTDCHTGESVYYSNQETQERDDVLTQLRASCSIPYFSPIVPYNNRFFVDGGVSEPIPIKKAKSDGFERNIVIVTQHKDYRKRPPRISKVLKYGYRRYPKLVHTMLNRHQHYNDLKAYIHDLEKKDEAFVIQPKEPLNLSRFTKDKNKLEAVYEYGYQIAKNEFPNLIKWYS